MWQAYRRNRKFLASVEGITTTRAQVAAVPMIHRSSYFAITEALTGGAERAITCVDYVTDETINVPVNMLQKITNDVVAPTKKKQITRYLTLVRNFLKVQYDDHAAIDNDDVSISSGA